MIEDFYNASPYAWTKEEKQHKLTKELLDLTRMHQDKCEPYRNILAALGFDDCKVDSVRDIPFLPVRIFKDLEMRSIEREQIFKTMTSSGTTGQAVSKIYLDRETALSQQKVMVKILSDYIGKKRLPMLIIDTSATVKDRRLFSARGAAIIGLTVVASELKYALNEDMSLNLEIVDDFFERHQGERVLVFGFTFMLWQHFYEQLLAMNKHYDLSEAFLFSGGGWKKLESQSVSREEYKKRFRDLLNVGHFLDHYGMVEQTGCIYTECEYGHLHASIYSDIIIRDSKDFSVCKHGTKGIIQAVSVLPRSYPGHSVLTEDEGIILGEDDCPCGRMGKYIQITGRIKNAELRGCSDVYATKF